MRVVIASQNPVKREAVERGFKTLFPHATLTYECVNAESGVSAQPLSGDEMRRGAIGRINHARKISRDADFYIGLEGGVEEMYGAYYNFGWVVIESKDRKQGSGRTMTFALPPAIQEVMQTEGLEQASATDKVLARTNTRTGTGTIGPLTNGSLTFVDWYTHAVICALIPFTNKELYHFKSA